MEPFFKFYFARNLFRAKYFTRKMSCRINALSRHLSGLHWESDRPFRNNYWKKSQSNGEEPGLPWKRDGKSGKFHCVQNAWLRPRILPYWDRLLPYIGIRRAYTGKCEIVFRHFRAQFIVRTKTNLSRHKTLKRFHLDISITSRRRDDVQTTMSF